MDLPAAADFFQPDQCCFQCRHTGQYFCCQTSFTSSWKDDYTINYGVKPSVG